MIKVIRQFHDGMKACVRSDYGGRLERFEVAQGLRQGCVVSPLLFNVLFAGADDSGLRRSLRHIWFDHLREQEGDHVHADPACTGNEDSPQRHGV